MFCAAARGDDARVSRYFMALLMLLLRCYRYALFASISCHFFISRGFASFNISFDY